MAGFVAVTAIVGACFPAWCVNMKNSYALLVVFMLPMLSPDPSHAFEWKNFWQTPDQQGDVLLQQEKSEQAASTFEDPEWKASALYRAEKYKESAQALDGFESADARYNRGNALAKSGDLEAAAEAYEQALKIDKAHEDASFNLDLVKKAMQKQQSEQQQSDDQNKSDKSDKNDKSEQKSDEKKQDDQPSESQQPEQQQSDEQQEQNEQSQSGQEKQTEADAEKEKERQQQAMQSSESTEQKNAEEEKMKASAEEKETDKELTEEEKAQQQWLRRIPDDPGGLLRRKFRYQYKQRGQQQANKEEQAW
jgi:Ca-activated chloride channel family protein